MIIGIANYVGRKNGVSKEAPVNTIAPVVSGTNTVGSVLTTTNGTWSGSLPITYTYQWLRNGSNITGATNSTYTLVTADTSNLVSCKVTATNLVGSANATSNSLTVYEAEYKNVLDYATTQGYTLPSTSQRLKQNTLLSSLKSAGVWTKLDTFVNFATDGDSNFALIDWKRLVQYTAVNSPTFTTNQGFTGNGTSSYISTNFNPAIGTNKYVLNNASRHIFVRTQSITASTLDGVASGNSNATVGVNTTLLRINQGATSIPTSADYSGSNVLKSIHRTSVSNIEIFVATTQTSRTFNSTTIINEPQLILARGVNVTGSYGGSQVSLYSMGANLVAENTAYVNAFNTYISSL